ncbi:MAG: hypothetical protein GX054_06525 [Clostridiales bacterium]|jgi:D-arabinose 1-dehydrogenase-like Zn-dependent alcohol dehydrogenase|nr:hypothetical protein [Clostridiales bacterium]
MIRTCTKWIEKICSKYDVLVELYCLYYRGIVKNEIALANIRNWDRVLCIGGGSIPSTAIEIAKQTKAQVHVVDIDSKAVKSARNVVSRLNLQEKITVFNARGQDIDIEPYDVIHIAQQVSPKEEVLENIWEKSREGNRIIVRVPRKILKPLYSNISDDFISDKAIEISSFSLESRGKTMDEILLMVKI